MYINNAIDVRDRESGHIYQASPQIVDLNFNGRYILRYNIGINGHTEWTNVCCLYSNDEFNRRYEVVKYQRATGEWVPIGEYKYWLDERGE